MQAPGILFSNAGSSEHTYQPPEANGCCCVLFERYLFAVSISAWCLLLYHAWQNVNYWLPILRFATFVKEYITSQYTVNANESCTNALPGSRRFRTSIICGDRPRLRSLSVTSAVTNSLTNSHTDTLQLYILAQLHCHGKLAAAVLHGKIPSYLSGRHEAWYNVAWLNSLIRIPCY